MGPSVARRDAECETVKAFCLARLPAVPVVLARFQPILSVLLLLGCGVRPARPSAAKPTASPIATAARIAVPVLPTPAVGPASADIGTAHPVSLEAASADGRWSVLCQAREDTDGDGRVSVTLGARGELLGDKMRSYFVEGTGAGLAIDEFVGTDGSRFVAMMRDGRLSIIDTLEHKTIDLSARGADARADAASYLPHRSVAFDARGERVLYLRRDADRTRAVVLDPKNGQELVIDPGVGALWRAELLPAAVVLYVVPGDTNGNGRLDFPVPEASSRNWRCRGPIPRFDAWQGRGDATEARVALGGATDALPVPGFVAVLGTDLVVREPSGRLVLQQPGTNQTLVTVAELAPARCGARVLHADETRRLLLVACTKAPGRAPVELVGVGYRNELKVSVEPRAYDAPPRASQRLFAFYPGGQGLLIDFETRRTTALETGETAIAIHDTRALTRRGNSLSVRDLVSGTVAALPGKLAEIGDVLHQPPVSYVTPLIVDLSNNEILGAIPNGARPLAVSRDGRALLPARSSDGTNLATGPLLWTTRP
jgi:hypothetical protein